VCPNVTRTPLVTVVVVLVVAAGVAVVLAATTALLLAVGSVAVDIPLAEPAPLDDSDGGSGTGEPPEERRVPGVAADGTVNISTVFAAHRDTLSANGYVAVTNVTVRDEGAILATTNRTVRSAPNGSTVLVDQRLVRGGEAERTTAWANESRTVTRRTDGRDVSVESGSRVPTEQVPPLSGVFRDAFAQRAGNFTVVNETVEGDRRVVTAVAPLERDGGPGTDPLRMRIDDRGVIRSVDATRPPEDGGGTVRIRYRLVELGVEEVQRPAWVTDANATGDADPTPEPA